MKKYLALSGLAALLVVLALFAPVSDRLVVPVKAQTQTVNVSVDCPSGQIPSPGFQLQTFVAGATSATINQFRAICTNPAGTQLYLNNASLGSDTSGVTTPGTWRQTSALALTSTTAVLGNTTATTWTFNNAFADTSYKAWCQLVTLTGTPTIAITTKAAGSLTITTVANSATISGGSVDCWAVHN